MLENVVSYIINLDDNVERYEESRLYLERESIKFERISAVDGRSTPKDAFQEYSDKISKVSIGRSLSATEIACFLSHKIALKEFLKTNYSYCLVFEDDMKLCDGFSDLIRGLIDYIEIHKIEWDVVNLSRECKRYFTQLEKFRIHHSNSNSNSNSNSFSLCAAHYFPILATGLLWSRRGAEAFLAEAVPVCMPVDIYIRALCMQRNRGLAFRPAPVCTTGAPSIIDGTGNRRKQPRYGGAIMHFFISQIREVRQRMQAKANKKRFAEILSAYKNI